MGKGKNKRRQRQPQLNDKKQIVQTEQQQKIASKSEVLSEQQRVKLSISKLESEVKELEQELEILRNSLHQKAQQLSDKRVELDAIQLKDVEFQNKKAEELKAAEIRSRNNQLYDFLSKGNIEAIENWIITNREAVPNLKSIISLYLVENYISIFIKLDYAVEEILEYVTNIYDIPKLIRKTLSDPNLINSKSFDKEKMPDSLIARVSNAPLNQVLSLSDVIMGLSDAYAEQFVNINIERVKNLDMHHSLLEFAKSVHSAELDEAILEAFETMLTDDEYSDLIQGWMLKIRVPQEHMEDLIKSQSERGAWYLQRILELQECNYEEKEEVIEVIDVNQTIDYASKIRQVTQSELNALLHNAVTYDDLEAVKLLMRNGAAPYTKDEYGKTALEIAFSHVSDNQIEIVREMIHDAPVTQYLIDLAKERNNRELIALCNEIAISKGWEKSKNLATTALEALDESNAIVKNIELPRMPYDARKDRDWPYLAIS